MSCWNLDPLEGSIQNLLSALYPPFEATAPTLLSQLFHIIDGRYGGDALRCLLDFLVPAKHILDSVQQAACAQYSDVLFQCEGWPLCLHDQVVVHLAPVDPLLLRPGDFYLQAAPFCDQSARIVVCSLLEEEGLVVELVEETPIPETSYPCIFSLDWLVEVNQGRHGTPLSQCLLATQQGVVRLPWERVAVPDFVEAPLSAGSSMASAPPSYQPLPPPLPHFPVDSSFPLPPSQESAPKQFPVTIPTSSSHTFSVQTRICPARHGIAVSLCLVDASAAASARPVRVKEAESESKPVGWVCPNMWFTGTDPTTSPARGGPARGGPARGDPARGDPARGDPARGDPARGGPARGGPARGDPARGGPARGDPARGGPARGGPARGDPARGGPARGGPAREDPARGEPARGDPARGGPARGEPARGEPARGGPARGEPARGELARGDPARGGPARGDSATTCKAEDQSVNVFAWTGMDKHKDISRREAAVAEGEYIDILQATMLFSRAQSASEEQKLGVKIQQTEPQMQRCLQRQGTAIPRPEAAGSAGTALHRPHAHNPEPPQCVRFPDKPCTPCMRRRQGTNSSRSQELRCRYRDSYQAAIQNPVSFGPEKEKRNMLAVVEEDGDRPAETEAQDPWCDVQEMWFDPGRQQSSIICKESGEKSEVPYWRTGDTNAAFCLDYRGTTEQTERTTLPFREPKDVHSAKVYVNGTSNTSRSLNQSEVISAKHRLPLTSAEMSALNTTLKPGERLQSRTTSSPNFPRRESMSDRRCSSLSTAVVDTSEKCALVIVEGQNVRRRENSGSCAEIPQLHVVKCKNSTAFGLVSPKISRRRMVLPDAAQPGSTFMTCRQNRSQADPPPEEQRTSQPASTRPRPDHLPLGSPDPRAHPLYSGVASLTGGRDRSGRAIVELYGHHQGWRSAVTSQELLQMLLYFRSITRRGIREAGMTIIFDSRKVNPQPQLYKALMELQETQQAVHSFVLLVDKESSRRPERCPGIQTEVVTSLKALLKLVEVNQLSCRLDGSLPLSHCDWTELHQKLFPFVSDLLEASGLLLRAIRRLEEPQRTDSVQTVQQCMVDQRTLMRSVLEDGRLVGLQREGGAVLARLRKESDLRYPQCEDLSDAVDSVSSLYNQMEEQAHVLVQRSNLSLEHLEHLLQLREVEGHLMQMQQWFHVEGERHLLEAQSVEDSGDQMEQILNSFTGFLIEANDRRHHAMTLVTEAERLQQAGPSYPETETFRTLVGTFRSGLEDFLCRAEACGRELQVMVNVCDFCEQATALATECTEYLDQDQSRLQDQDQTTSPVSHTEPTQHQDSGPSSAAPDLSILQAFQDRFLQFSPDRFQEVKVQAGALRGSRGMQVWNVAWLRCQEARQQLQERMQHQTADPSGWCEQHYVDVVSTSVQTASPGGQGLVVQSTPGPRHPQWEGIVSGEVDLEKRRPIVSDNSNSAAAACCTVKPEEPSDAGSSQGSKVTAQTPHSRSARRAEREARRRQRDAAALSQSHPVGCQWFPWGRGLGSRSLSQDSCATAAATAGSSTPPEPSAQPPSSCSHHGQPSCRILQEAQKFQISRHGSFCSDDSCVSDRGAAGGNRKLGCKHSSLPVGRCEEAFGLASPQESASNALRLLRVLEELVFTEREYVRSLGYILTHYLPLLDRPDVPQDLRGKRGVIFGNLEKLYDFHSHYFLPELEACQREPAMVARCFLRHSDSLGLYSLYSKNKPLSDALILHRRHDIFKRKQQELGDMMDLSSYLLRPIQRISKYSLLLQDMLALSGSYRPKDGIQDRSGPGSYAPDVTSGERERAEIQAAADLVRFQMRHGNDLLTMDAIQDCDVNLKEQGRLIRQDEFTVFIRKKKCVRRVFLFQDLVLFSKTKKTDVGNDVYVYKQSFKTSDIGMTLNSSVSSLCFEIWFRRRKSEDTYTLKASSLEVKKAWTSDLERILWDQAAHSRELRIQERVFMGMSRKPFMDIQPSDAAICDRAVSCGPSGRIPVACCSHRGVDFPRPRSIGSGSTASTTFSQSSSSSGRGSLPPAGYPGNQSQGGETGPGAWSSPDGLTEQHLSNHRLHQHHLHRNCEQWKSHHSLNQCLRSESGDPVDLFRTSEHNFLSTVDDASSVASQSSKPRPSLCRTPSVRRDGSPAVNGNKPGVAPKPPHLAHAQGDDIIIGKSTEV